MSDISDIRPAYPVVPVKRRDREPEGQDKKPKPAKKPPPRVDESDDSSPHIIDEYV